MDVTIFEYLLALAETGSLTGAAKKFFISPSALSQRLSREEQELNCILFQRKGGRFIPTKEGEIYLKYAREALHVRDDTYLHLKRLVSGRPSLRIASSHQLFQEAAGRILPKLQALFPESRFDLFSADSPSVRQYLLNDLADMGLLCLMSSGDSLLDQIVLGTDQLTAVIPTALLGPEEGPSSLKGSQDLPFVLINDASPFRSMENELLREAHIYPGTIYEVENFLVARDLMRAGSGITLLPASMADSDSSCQILPLDTARKYYRILAWPKYRPLSPEGEAARRLITEELSGSYGF